MATSNETCAPTSRKYVAGQGIVMPHLSKTFETLLRFYFRKTMVNQSFRDFPTIKREPFVATFNEMRAAPTSKEM